MTVLRFDDDSGNARGLLSFFAVHGTSIYEVIGIILHVLRIVAYSFLEQHFGQQR